MPINAPGGKGYRNSGAANRGIVVSHSRGWKLDAPAATGLVPTNLARHLREVERCIEAVRERSGFENLTSAGHVTPDHVMAVVGGAAKNGRPAGNSAPSAAAGWGRGREAPGVGTGDGRRPFLVTPGTFEKRECGAAALAFFESFRLRVP